VLSVHKTWIDPGCGYVTPLPTTHPKGVTSPTGMSVQGLMAANCMKQNEKVALSTRVGSPIHNNNNNPLNINTLFDIVYMEETSLFKN
jgi:hypothetical protein